MIKISVIIPVYNTEKYLNKCLDSVCNQTLSELEIICVDDCSTDNSLQVLKQYQNIDNRIKILALEKNQGASNARNKGIELAQGEYISFIDSDDYIDLDFYEKLYSKVQNSNPDAIKGKIKLECEYDIYRDIFYDTNKDIEQNKAYFYHSFTSAIYKSNFIKENNILFPENKSTFEDPYFSIVAGLHYKNITLVNNTCYHYNLKEGSLTSLNFEKRLETEPKTILEITDILNSAIIDIKHYSIVFAFLIKHLYSLMNLHEYPASYSKIIFDALYYAYDKCKYKEECIAQFVFEEKKANSRYENKKRIADLRKATLRG